MAVVDGVREREKAHSFYLRRIEAAKWRLDAEDGDEVARALLPELAEADDDLDGIDIEATTPMVRKLIEDREREEAERWYAENGDVDGEEGEG